MVATDTVQTSNSTTVISHPSKKTNDYGCHFRDSIHATFAKYAERSFMSIAYEDQQDTNSMLQWSTYADVYQKIMLTYVPQLISYKENSCIGLFVSNASMKFYQLQMACALCKLVTIGLAPTMSNEQLKNILTIAKCNTLFILDKKDDTLVQRISTITHGLPTEIDIIYCNDNDKFDRHPVVHMKKITSMEENTYDINESLFSMIFTSGSTGMPKGVGLTVQRWLKETQVPLSRNHPSGPLVIISFTQPAWYMSQWSVWRAFWCGGQIGFSRGGLQLFDAVRLIQPTIFFAPPVVWNLLYQQYETIIEKMDVNEACKYIRNMIGGRVVSISTGSAPIAPVVFEFLQHVFGDSFQIYDGYGLTETGHVLKDGRPQRHVDVKLVPLSELISTNTDDDKNECITGELYVRTPFMVHKYINDPVETEKAFTKDGWFCTGDVFQLIAPNTYKFVDRIKSFIKSEDGTFLSSSSVECLLLKHPSVRQSFVHSVNGHIVAVVVLIEDSVNRQLSSTDIIDFVRTNHGPILRAVIIEHEPWSIENGLLTLSMKYARPALLRKYQSVLADAIREQRPTSINISHPSTHASTLDWLTTTISKMACISINKLIPTQTIAELGLNSLEAVRLTLTISSAFPNRHIPASIILNQSLDTITLFIDEPSTNLNHQQVASKFQIQAQQRVATEIQKDIDDAINTLTSLRTNQIVSMKLTTKRNAFLTGGTGFIGSRMLHDLLTFKTKDMLNLFEKVFCLVRTKTVIGGKNRLVNTLKYYELWQESFNDRIECIQGSMDETNCGINTCDYNRLVDEVTDIYNVAAVVHWRRSYNELRKPNVLGTVDLLRLALSSVPTKSFHHLSTIGVLSNALKTTNQTHLAFWRDDALATCENTHRHLEYISEDVDIGTDASICSQDNGYSQTKWCCDRIIEELKKKLPEFDVRIYRLGFIGWSIETGIGNRQDFIVRLVATILQLGVYPCFSPDDAINLAPVEYTSASIIASSCSMNSPSSTVSVYNVTNNHSSGLGKLTYEQLIFYMKEFGYVNLKQVDHRTWIRLIAEKPTLPLYPLLFVVADGFSAAWFLADTHMTKSLVCSPVTEPTDYFLCPAITASVVHSHLQWMIDQSIIEPPVVAQ